LPPPFESSAPVLQMGRRGGRELRAATLASMVIDAGARLFLVTVMVLALPAGLLFLLHWLVRSSGRFAVAAVRTVLDSAARAGDRLIVLCERFSRDAKAGRKKRNGDEVKPAVTS
jgi:hypothetical protein